MSYYMTATDTTITFHVTLVEGRDRYRLFWRLPSETAANADTVEPFRDFQYTVYGLAPSTTYVVNVAHWDTSVSTEDYILMGAQEITTEAYSRPDDWSWLNISKGGVVPKNGEKIAPVTASEWNSFCARINEFREHKNLSSAYPFTTVSKGMEITNSILSQAIFAISDIPGHGTLPTKKDALSADFWLGLAAALNAVE